MAEQPAQTDAMNDEANLRPHSGATSQTKPAFDEVAGKTAGAQDYANWGFNGTPAGQAPGE